MSITANDVAMDFDDFQNNDTVNRSTDPAGKNKKNSKMVYVPGVSRPLKEGEELVYDASAYRIFVPFETEHACLSLDWIPQLVDHDSQTCNLVSGTQAEDIRHNFICAIQLCNLVERVRKTSESSSDSSEDDDDDVEDEKNENTKRKPLFRMALIEHHGGINRIRAAHLGVSCICGCWNDQGKVGIWNLTPALATLDALHGSRNKVERLKKQKPMFTFPGHQCEGFAIDWCSLIPGRLATGDSRRNIHLWNMHDGGTSWAVDQRPFSAHSSSVEDIQWSPSEPEVFASCSSDGSIRLWDARAAPSNACVFVLPSAHNNSSDVNVINWNTFDTSLLLSGGDDGSLRIWDLRVVKEYQEPVAQFNYHRGPITSVAWSSHDSTIFAATGEDDLLTLWDLSVEPDVSSSSNFSEKLNSHVPPQLLFVHQGQQEMKEVRWMKNLEGCLACTALSGFNFFRTISI